MTYECKGCEKRYVGCHSECEAYKAYKQYLAELKAKERAGRMTTWWTPQESNRIYKNVRIKNSQSRK